MARKPLNRTYRSGKLSAEQAARDEEIRGMIQTEFPPLETAPSSPVLSDPLRAAIERGPKTVPQLAEEANVSEVILRQFLAGQRDLRLATAEKLAHALGLKLVASCP